jgi:pSer/pThr/pTyr-binding forkhead associated (FHA) protein
VRQRGRLFKRLYDEAVDVSAVRAQLLDPEFDLAAWLRKRELVEKPVVDAGAPSVMAAAQLKGTQHVKLSDFLPASSRRPHHAGEHRVAPPSSRRHEVQEQGPSTERADPAPLPPMSVVAGGHTVLSIGLRMPQAPISSGPIKSAAITRRAWFESKTGQRWELAGAVISIGRDPAGTIALPDPGASHLHAQLTSHMGALFLRDVGSRNGTWVNGAQVTVPHLLREGDRVTIGTTELVFRTSDATAAPPTPAARSVPATSGDLPIPASGVATLVGASGKFAGQRFDLLATPSTIGREATAHIRIEDLSISRRHAMLTRAREGWLLSDLHSSAGTTHNGAKVLPGSDVLLREGDTIQLGAVMVTFRTTPQ